MQLIIRVVGAEAAQSKLQRLASGAFKARLMVAVGGLLERQTKKRVAEEKTAPSGAAWAPWSKSYAAGKSQKGRGLLVRSSRLLGSITNIPGSDSAIVGTNVFYAKFHQSGTSKMVAREFVGVSAANASEIEKVTQAFLSRLLG